jgi:integrase
VQVDALAAAADAYQPGTGPMIVLMAWSGLRWGEAVALRQAAIDVDRRRVHVREAATEVHGKLLFGTPKSHEARSVIVPRFVLEPLLPRLKAIGPEDLVFTSPKGAPLRNGNFRKSVWRRAVQDSGVPADLMPHDLRDTAASLMISAGASIVAVARALGHADPALTLRVYAGLYEDDLEDLADKMEHRYRASRPGARERAEGHSATDRVEPDVSADSAGARRARGADLEAGHREADSL